MTRPLALITGASSGIGAELARIMAAEGHDLVLVARSVDALQAMAEELRHSNAARAEILPLDLGKPGAAAELAAKLAGREIDVLVNNAGFGDGAAFTEADPAKLDAMMQLNMVTLTQICRAFLPGMTARRRGRVLNVASTAAFQPGPGMAVYFATKSYVLSLGVALAEELRGSGVTVTTLCPGPTETNFAKAADVGGNRMFQGKLLPVMTAPAVARIGWRAAKAGRRVVVAGLMNKLGAITAKLSPLALSARITAMMTAK